MPPKRGLKPSKAGASKKQKATRAEASKGASAVAVDIEECSFTAQEVSQVRLALLDWYDTNHRILPWRRNPHSKLGSAAVAAAAAKGRSGAPEDMPQNQFIYWVWVCEVMSQQTQVSRAAEYFIKWTKRWPTVEGLAQATQEEVNDMWAGLGYYRRARFLLEGAKYVMEQLGGQFPRTSKELQKIPGVGAYTGNAIASIACSEVCAVVDGNVVRVLARLRRVGGDPRSGAAVKLFGELAAALVHPDRPGDFNQAMMELGATVCVPNTQPQCAACPVSACCSAYKAVQQHQAAGGAPAAAKAPSVLDYPAKVEKAERREVTVAVAVVQLVAPGSDAAAVADAKFLLVQRPKDGLLAGLWEFPLLEMPATSKRPQLEQAMSRYLETLLAVDVEQQPAAAAGGAGASRAAAAGERRRRREEGHQQQQREGEQEGLREPTEVQVGGGEGAATAPPAAGTAGAAAGRPRVQLLSRSSLGDLVHVFSHIRMTLKVERVVLQGCLHDLPTPRGKGDAGISTTNHNSHPPSSLASGEDCRGGGCGATGSSSGLQWLGYAELESRGLSSSVRKVWGLLQKAVARSEAAKVFTGASKGVFAKRKARAGEAPTAG